MNPDAEGYIKPLMRIPLKEIKLRQLNYLKGQAAARGSFYERYKKLHSKDLEGPTGST